MIDERTLRAQLADLLGIPADQLADDDNLLDHGLDSIRIMSLVDAWRESGVEVSFIELAEEPTLANWRTLLSAQHSRTAGS
ncbi:isochorismatase [Actinosynnema sp. ALI-1.44]|uniref:phosphopantetheine-binding protein n=1 Tax=Actinosynnema sp. ALI-1.44 TaxID=1933779 RepID=UPI00097BF59A|nr:phosphopantetheine-binding protein [Actinosynnema sp. ALI-1.44]ONI75154.1 isochorismatase [Actinosynnema sp. ALI-1.44]